MAEAATIKVSVLASGEVLLDKQPVSLADLSAALEQGAKSKAQVWYYRENAHGEAPPVVADVIKLIASKRLPIRMSSQPDFSDAITPAALGQPDFAAVRQRAAQSQLVVVRPDGQYAVIPVGAKDSFPPELIASAESMMPSTVQRNVAVIGETAWAGAASPTLQAANRAIPFFGHLLGFSTIGHAVWVFDARDAAALSAGCQEADVLLVDSQHQAVLPNGWKEIAAKAMRHPQILVHDRKTHQLRKA